MAYRNVELLNISFRGYQLEQAYEKGFLERVNADEALKAKYGNLLNELNSLYSSLQPYAEVNAYHAELTGRNTLMLNVAYYMNRLEKVYNSQGEEAFQKAFQKKA